MDKIKIEYISHIIIHYNIIHIIMNSKYNWIVSNPTPRNQSILEILACKVKSAIISCDETNTHIIDKIPINIKHIIFTCEFTDPLFSDMIPPWIETLEYYGSIEFPLSSNILPIKLLHLTLGKYTNVIDGQNLSVNLTYLHIDSGNYKLRNSLPLSLKYFHMGEYNGALMKNILPPNLLSLDLGYKFNNFISPGVLPENLISLHFSKEYNKTLIIGTLPPNLELIRFGYEFNKRFNLNCIPNSVRYIYFGEKFMQPIFLDTLPRSLELVSFRNYPNILTINQIPDNINIIIDISSNDNHHLNITKFIYPKRSFFIPYINKDMIPVGCDIIGSTYDVMFLEPNFIHGRKLIEIST